MWRVLELAGGELAARDGNEFLVEGLGADVVARLALAHGLELHELVTHRRSLESAYLELTQDSVDYRSRPVYDFSSPLTSHQKATPMTTTAPDTVARRTGGPTLRRVLASELLKLRGLRSTIVLLLVAVASIVLLGPINAVGQVVEDEPVHGVGDALSLVLMGASNAAILLGVLGVLSATSEYAYDSVHVTFTAVPRRADVVLGKALALTSALVPVVLFSVVIAWEAGRRILHHGGVDLGWTDPDVVRVMAATTWYLAGWALLGQSLGWLLRSAVGAASALLGVMFVLPVLTLLIPGKAGETVGRLMVSEAGAAMLRTDQQGPGLGPLAGALVWTLYLALGIGAAVLVTNRRDA